jgi:hypothetical protein
MLKGTPGLGLGRGNRRVGPLGDQGRTGRAAGAVREVISITGATWAFFFSSLVTAFLKDSCDLRDFLHELTFLVG